MKTFETAREYMLKKGLSTGMRTAGQKSNDSLDLLAQAALRGDGLSAGALITGEDAVTPCGPRLTHCKISALTRLTPAEFYQTQKALQMQRQIEQLAAWTPPLGFVRIMQLF
ncbi:hypothetical protein [Geoalkalibacter subterraneus]|uniref:hypothetical protein n=1 Tax=Geoalkalibacter subterraneus TaxID=483547 RepID=UPI001185A295|nr:hypothetical protein [Geoalkalibacter subterraneus]